jgi:hypothetical protein
MKWKAKYTQTHYPQGSTRLKRVFAWLPVQIGDEVVWMERFEILQTYELKQHTVVLDQYQPGEKTNFVNLG